MPDAPPAADLETKLREQMQFDAAIIRAQKRRSFYTGEANSRSPTKPIKDKEGPNKC